MASFSQSAAISYGWKTTMKNLKFFVVLLLIMFAVNVIPSNLARVFDNNNSPLIGFILALIGWILQFAVSLGVIGVALKVYDRKKVQYSNLFDYIHLIIPYVVAGFIYGVIVLVGLILLIVPGIIWGIKYRYFVYFMVDKNKGPIDALKASAKITKGQKWNLFLLGLMLLGLNVLGALALLVGLFVTIPATIMAEAYVFRKLSNTGK
ncbi:MAG TPA: DUF975 family protein [Patescibacteria group bacterium]|nr:DUF975 family protein [Patescibacteria group bacterium]